MGLPANQAKVVVIPHLLLHLTTLWDLVDHRALDINLVAMHKVSFLPAAGDQALWAQWQAIIPFVPMLLKMVSSESESSHDEGDDAAEDGNAREHKSRVETSSDGQVASDGEEG